MKNDPPSRNSGTDHPDRAAAARLKLSAALHSGFALLGIVSNLLGALLPAFAARWALADAQAGYLFMAQFAGSLTGNLICGRVIQRLGVLRTLAGSYFLMAAGVAGLGAGSRLMAEAAVFAYGVAMGSATPTVNLLVAESNPEKRASALNLINMSWGIGAVACAPLALPFARGQHLGLFQDLLAGSLLVIAILIIRAVRDASPRVVAREQEGALPVSPWRNPVVVLIGSIIFFYVGTENAIGGWISTFTRRTLTSWPAAWPFSQPAFWAALLGGRALAPLILRRLSERRLVLAGLSVAAAGTMLLAGAEGSGAHWTGIALSGAGLAAVFPNTVAIYSRVFGTQAATSAGPIFAVGGLGGAFMPWLVGVASSRAGSLRTGLLIAVLGTLLMIDLQVVLMAFLRRSESPKPIQESCA